MNSGEPDDLRQSDSDRRKSITAGRRLAGNLGSLLTSTVFERAMRFALYAAVARSLGASSLGQLALAVAILQLTGRIILLGIPVLATRQVARDRSSIRRFAFHGGAIVTVTSLLGYGAVAAFVAVAGYESATTRVVWILLIGLIPFAWSQLSEAILIGLEQAKYIAFVTVPVNLIQAGVAIALLRQGSDVVAVAFSLAVAYGVRALPLVMIVTAAMRQSEQSAAPHRTNLVREAAPFLGIEAMTVLRTTSIVVIVSLILGEAAVGIFSAAVQLQMPLRVVGTVLAAALFPILTNAMRRGRRILTVAATRSIELTIAVVLPGVVGLLAIADDLLELVYDGEEFSAAVSVLNLIAFAALAMAVSSIMGRILMAADRELLTLRIAIVNTVTQVVIGVLMTSAFGLIGAAGAALAVSLLNIAQHTVPIRRLIPSLSLLRAGWIPLAASLAMLASLLAVTDLPVLVRTVIGTIVYFATFSAVSIVSAGGWISLKERWGLIESPDHTL